MCKIFSALVTKSCRGYYDNKDHSHTHIQEQFVSQDIELRDNELPPHNTFGKIEITAENGNILFPNEWVFELDEYTIPEWWTKRHKEKAWEMHAKWLKWLHSKVDVTKYPKNPFLMKSQPFKKIGDLIRDSIPDLIWYWIGDSIRHSIGGSIPDSIRYSIGDPIRHSIGGSIPDLIRYSIGDSIRYWIGLHIDNMCKVDLKEEKQIIELWEKGIVPVWYQDAWHYFGSPNGDGKCEEIK